MRTRRSARLRRFSLTKGSTGSKLFVSWQNMQNECGDWPSRAGRPSRQQACLPNLLHLNKPCNPHALQQPEVATATQLKGDDQAEFGKRAALVGKGYAEIFFSTCPDLGAAGVYLVFTLGPDAMKVSDEGSQPCELLVQEQPLSVKRGRAKDHRTRWGNSESG